ncbi:MAG: glycosyltransferase [Bacilli bacterium]
MANAQENTQAQQHIAYQAQIVTYNSATCILACVASLLQQELPPDRIVILDNASQDGTANVLRQQVAQLVAAHPASIDLSIHINKTNVGYAAGHNHCLSGALGTTGAPKILATPEAVEIRETHGASQARQAAQAAQAPEPPLSPHAPLIPPPTPPKSSAPLAPTLPHTYVYVLTVNPDVVLAPDYAQKVIARAQAADSRGIRVGGVSGRLLRAESADEQKNGSEAESTTRSGAESTAEPESSHYPVDIATTVPATIDSAGLRMGAFLHARDRGAGREDEGQFETPQPVWGVCGAAALYNMTMLRELAEHGPIFDDTFFIYKEDVDLCWRARLLGWSFHYEPSAVAHHDRGWKRHHTPSTAAAAHSFANQVAIVAKYLDPRRPFFWACLLAESARFVLLTVRDPDAASLALRHIRENRRWNRNQRLVWLDARAPIDTASTPNTPNTAHATSAPGAADATSAAANPPGARDDRRQTPGGSPWNM